ncbi:uncharacterized protein LOC143894295 isoform X2 [Temnothorax americanus]
MESHSEFAAGKFLTKERKVHHIKQWEELTIKLNRLSSGTQKSTKQWQTVWRDMKNTASKKASKLRNERQRTGNFPVTAQPLSTMDQRVIACMGLEYVQRSVNCPDSTPEEEEHQQRLERGETDVLDYTPTTTSIEDIFVAMYLLLLKKMKLKVWKEKMLLETNWTTMTWLIYADKEMLETFLLLKEIRKLYLHLIDEEPKKISLIEDNKVECNNKKLVNTLAFQHILCQENCNHNWSISIWCYEIKRNILDACVCNNHAQNTVIVYIPCILTSVVRALGTRHYRFS